MEAPAKTGVRCEDAFIDLSSLMTTVNVQPPDPHPPRLNINSVHPDIQWGGGAQLPTDPDVRNSLYFVALAMRTTQLGGACVAPRTDSMGRGEGGGGPYRMLPRCGIILAYTGSGRWLCLN